MRTVYACTFLFLLQIIFSALSPDFWAEGAVNPGGLPVYNIVDFGAVGDSAAMNTQAIQKAIDTAAEKGGGIVYFPAGDFLSGSIVLKSNITLYLDNGCTVWGSSDPDDFAPVREERPSGQANMAKHFIFAEDAHNIAIRGDGTIDGNGPAFWPVWKPGMDGTDFFVSMLDERGVSSRPGPYIQFERCTQVVIEGVTFRYSPFWMMHIIDCHNVRLSGVTVIQGMYEADGPNTDGINFSGCSDIRVSDCAISTGDDCLVLRRSGRDAVITNCVLKTTESALVLTPGPGELRNVSISNCAIHDAGSAITGRVHRGGVIDGVAVTNLTYELNRKKGGNLIFLRSHPEETPPEPALERKLGIKPKVRTGPPGIVRNITITNVTATADGAIFIDGLPDSFTENVVLDNIRFHMRGGQEKPTHADPPSPFFVYGHHSAPYDVFCRYVRNLRIRGLEFHWNKPEKAEWGSAMRFHHAEDLEIDGFVGRQALGSDQPAVSLRDVDGAFIHGCRAPEGTGTFLGLSDGTRDVTLMGNDLSKARKTVEIGKGISPDQIYESGNRLRE